MDMIEYDALVRPDAERGRGYRAISTARYCGAVTITNWEWTGYGATPEEAIADLERRLQEVHKDACLPRRIVYIVYEVEQDDA